MTIIKNYQGLAETSTVPISFDATSTLGAAISCAANQTGTLVVRPWALAQAGTVILATTTATQPVSFATTSTIGAAISVAANQTGTIPVSFLSTSTIGAAVTWAVSSTIQVPTHAVTITSTIAVLLANTTGTVGAVLSTTSTVPVSFATTSTIGAAVTIPTSSTINIGGTISVGALVGAISSTIVYLATASSAYALPQGALASRKTLILRNATSATLWIGSASVSTAVGFPLMENEVLSLDAGANVSIYGFSETANSTAALIEMS